MPRQLTRSLNLMATRFIDKYRMPIDIGYLDFNCRLLYFFSVFCLINGIYKQFQGWTHEARSEPIVATATFFRSRWPDTKKFFAPIELLAASSHLRSGSFGYILLSNAACYSSLTIIESLSMTRRLLSVVGAALLCAQSLPTLAADSTQNSAASASQAAREAFEQKRDQASGVSDIAKPRVSGPSTVLDAPIATDDDPAQAQQP